MSNTIIKELTDAEIAIMSYDRLERLILHHLVCAGLYSRTELLRDLGLESADRWEISGPLDDSRARLEAAVNMLFDKGLISSNSVRGDDDGIILTPEGETILDLEDFRNRSKALVRVSNQVLRSELQSSRLCFLEGQYEDALSRSIESIETRVRTLSNPRKHNVDGAKLMKHAFGKGGVLSGGTSHRSRSQAVMDLFAGAVAVDSPSLMYGRREGLQRLYAVTEVMLFANLLHHVLDQYDQ